MLVHLCLCLLLSLSCAVSEKQTSTEARHLQLETYYETLLRTQVTSETLQDSLVYSKQFLQVQPFPYFVATDIFPREVLRAVSKEIRDSPLTTNGGCVEGGTCHNDGVRNRAHTVFKNVDSFGPATDALHRFMRSTTFIDYLQLATGMDSLVIGSEATDIGVHQFLTQGFEKVHTDVHLDKPRGLHRRLNLFLCLNHQWKSSYGGHLELWSRDLEHCAARIAPDLGKMVVFATTDFSYHGHQTPLSCPPTRSNRMIVMDYYTTGRPSSECLEDNCFRVREERYPDTLCPVCAGVCTYAPV